MIKILKPKVPGTFVRDPETHEKLPPEGKTVRMDTPSRRSFWNRRIADGSVVEVFPTPEPKSKKENDK